MSTTIHHVSNPLSRGCASCILTPSWASNSRRVGHLVNEQPSFQAPSTQLIWAERDFIAQSVSLQLDPAIQVNGRLCNLVSEPLPLLQESAEQMLKLNLRTALS